MEALIPWLSLENSGILACSSVITTQLLFLLLRDANPVLALAGGIEAECWVLGNSVYRSASRFRPEIVVVVSSRREQTTSTLKGT